MKQEEYHMKKVKITILKTTLNKDLAEEYGVKGLDVCPIMKEGQVFYACLLYTSKALLAW